MSYFPQVDYMDVVAQSRSYLHFSVTSVTQINKCKMLYNTECHVSRNGIRMLYFLSHFRHRSTNTERLVKTFVSKFSHALLWNDKVVAPPGFSWYTPQLLSSYWYPYVAVKVKRCPFVLHPKILTKLSTIYVIINIWHGLYLSGNIYLNRTVKFAFPSFWEGGERQDSTTPL